MTEEEELQFAISMSLTGAPSTSPAFANPSLPIASSSTSATKQNSTPARPPTSSMSIQDQLAEVRRRRAMDYQNHQVEQAVEATRSVKRNPGEGVAAGIKEEMSTGMKGESVSGTTKGRKRTFEEERMDEDVEFVDEKTDDDDDTSEIEYVGMVKKKKRETVQSDIKPTIPSRAIVAHNPTASTSASASSSSNAPIPTYLKPSIRLTRTSGRTTLSSKRKNTVLLSDIIQRDQVQKGFVFSFFIAQDEFFEYLPVGEWAGNRKVEMIIGRDMHQDPVSHLVARKLNLDLSPSSYRPMESDTFDKISKAAAEGYEKIYGENFRAVYCRKVRSGCAHSKVGVLVYEGFLRVFITSANFMALDLEHGDNHWFIVDLPELPRRRSTSLPVPEFEQELLEHIQALGCPKKFVNTIFAKYDYSSVANISIVASIPSSAFYKDEERARYGCMRLRDVVQPILEDHPEAKKGIEMEICSASIGGMQEDWLRGMNHCFTGGRYKPLDRTDIPDFTMIFPTRPDVEATREISQAGASQIGSHFKFPDAKPEIKAMFRHYLSKDQMSDGIGKGCLFHQKFYMAFPKGNRKQEEATRKQGQSSTDETATPPLYAYLGSANFSKAAWGKAVPEVKKKQPASGEMMRLGDVCNYELGVVIRGHDIQGMLEPGSVWEDVVPHQRWTAGYVGRDKPYNSEAWVKH